MKDFYTTERVMEAWFEAERNGINTMQSRGDQIVMDWVDRYRDMGGTMHWVVQTASEWKDGDVPDNIRAIAEHDPIAIYHHGSRTDNLWKQGRIDEIGDHVKQIKDRGLLAGVGSHMPEVFEYIEEKDWDADFYMTSVYNLSRVDRDSALAGGTMGVEIYDEDDRRRMLEVIAKTKRQCIVFKILAAGRRTENQEMVREVFRDTFERIKPHDVVDVGVFQRDQNEIALNAEHVRAVLSGQISTSKSSHDSQAD